MKKFILFILLFIITFSFKTFSQGVAVPNGTGAWGNSFILGVGITTPQPYIPKTETLIKRSDLVSTLGFGIGNPMRNVGFQLNINMLDVSEADYYNIGLKLHRYIAFGFSLGIGAENVLEFGDDIKPEDTWDVTFNDNGIGDAGFNYYGAITHDFRYIASPDNPLSRLSYTIGVGYGRFSILTPLDKANQNGTPTSVFGAVKYDIVKDAGFIDCISTHVEWTGTNLNAGLSIKSHLGPIPVGIALMAGDFIESNSGTGIRFIGGAGIMYQIKSKAQKRHEDEAGPEHYRDLIALNEANARNKLLQLQNRKILESNAKIQDKLEIMEEEMNKLKEDQDNPKYNDGDDIIKPNNYGEPENNGVVNLEDDKIININEEEDGGYDVEPGNYVVIHSLQKRSWAKHSQDGYTKIGVETKIAYNRDKQMHYIYTNKFSVNEHKEALIESTNQRRKGFDGAWVFYKPERDVGGLYYEKQNIDSIVSLDEDYIVYINAGDSSGYNATPGFYVVVHSLKKKDDAISAEKALNKEGIRTNMLYDKNREQHYVYTDKLYDIDEAWEKRDELKDEFNGVWILQKKVIQQNFVKAADVVGVTNMKNNEIIKIDQGNDSFYNIEPGNYVVIGSYQNKANAVNTVDNYNKRNIPSLIAFNKDRDLFYVYTHMYSDVNKAIDKKNELRKNDAFKSAWVFSY